MAALIFRGKYVLLFYIAKFSLISGGILGVVIMQWSPKWVGWNTGCHFTITYKTISFLAVFFMSSTAIARGRSKWPGPLHMWKLKFLKVPLVGTLKLCPKIPGLICPRNNEPQQRCAPGTVCPINDMPKADMPHEQYVFGFSRFGLVELVGWI